MLVSFAYYLVFLMFSVFRFMFSCGMILQKHQKHLSARLVFAKERSPFNSCFTVQIAQMSLSYCVSDSFDPAHFRWFCNVFLTIALRIEGLIMSLLHFHFHFVIKTLWNFRFWVHLSKRHYKVIHFEGVCFGSLGDPLFLCFLLLGLICVRIVFLCILRVLLGGL